MRISKILYAVILVAGVLVNWWLLPCIEAAEKSTIANESSIHSYVYFQSLETVYGDRWHIAVDHGVKSNGVQVKPNTIYFYKVEGDGKRLISSNMIEDHFLCTNLLRDNSNLIYTVWIGTTYWVRVYSLDKDTVRLLVEVGSYYPPNFITMANGKQALLIDKSERESKRPYIYDVYEFGENAFRLVKNLSLNQLPNMDNKK